MSTCRTNRYSWLRSGSRCPDRCSHCVDGRESAASAGPGTSQGDHRERRKHGGEDAERGRRQQSSATNSTRRKQAYRINRIEEQPSRAQRAAPTSTWTRLDGEVSTALAPAPQSAHGVRTTHVLARAHTARAAPDCDRPQVRPLTTMMQGRIYSHSACKSNDNSLRLSGLGVSGYSYSSPFMRAWRACVGERGGLERSTASAREEADGVNDNDK